MIAWYVDSNKVLHVDEDGTWIIGKIAEHFGKLAVSRGGKHRFLEMDMEFLGNSKSSMFMKYYI